MGTPQQVTKVPRTVLVERLRERDGDRCQFPGCHEAPLDFTVDYTILDNDDPLTKREPTIDHWVPQYWAKANGWTPEQIWDLDNLKLMSKACNAKKGDRLPNADGTLPPKPQSTFRFRRQKRAGRPELCGICDNGHNLFAGEVCANCGCDAQRFPRHAFAKSNKCDHELFWCWACSIGVIPRPAAVETAVLQSESGEWE